MKRVKQLFSLGMIVLTAMFSTAAQVRADDDQDPTNNKKVRIVITADEDLPQKIKKRRAIFVAEPGGGHWIGVYAVPAGAALKSHLGIEDRLIVEQVIDDSPAKKAGVQSHDILLKYGDASITTVEDLLKAVGKSEDKETSLAIIRGGKKMSLKVKAVKRPENRVGFNIKLDHLGADVHGSIGEWIHEHAAGDGSRGPFRFHIIGPGVIDHKIDIEALHKALSGAQVKMPKNLSIQINKSGETVAKIKVTLDGKTWEVTEENLGKLPEGVRAHVKRVLGREHGRAVIGFAPSGHEIRLKALQIHPEDGHEGGGRVSREEEPAAEAESAEQTEEEAADEPAAEQESEPAAEAGADADAEEADNGEKSE